jgi:hypothetical protein
MSTQHRTAHVTGFNNDVAGQLPERGSYYAPVGGGAPGFLGGPIGGFTVAFSLHNWAGGGNPVWGDADSIPGFEVQFIVGSPGAADEGWFLINEEGSDMEMFLGDASVAFGGGGTLETQDLIGVVSYIPDDSFYGGAGVTHAVSSLNGELEGQDEVTGLVYAPGTEFSLLGTGSPLLVDPTDVAGCRYAQFGSFWLTPGIPDMFQLQDFLQASMKAGEVVPAAWAPARTAVNPDPETPSSPTGHHFRAGNVVVRDGLASTWTDTIGGVVLERVGTISGAERELARDPQYYSPLV